MRCVSAAEAKQRLAAAIDAARREPVLSPLDYERLTTNVEEFQRFCDRVSRTAKARGMSEEALGDLLDG